MTGMELEEAFEFISSELLYLYSLLTEETELVDQPPFPYALTEIGKSLLAHPRFDYLSADDPRPFVRDLVTLL